MNVWGCTQTLPILIANELPCEEVGLRGGSFSSHIAFLNHRVAPSNIEPWSKYIFSGCPFLAISLLRLRMNSRVSSEDTKSMYNAWLREHAYNTIYALPSTPMFLEFNRPHIVYSNNLKWVCALCPIYRCPSSVQSCHQEEREMGLSQIKLLLSQYVFSLSPMKTHCITIGFSYRYL